MKIGNKVRFSFSHLLETVVFSARIVKIKGEFAWVEIPEQIRNLPFPPLKGKRYGIYKIKDLKEDLKGEL